MFIYKSYILFWKGPGYDSIMSMMVGIGLKFGVYRDTPNLKITSLSATPYNLNSKLSGSIYSILFKYIIYN